jgi:hypothetical protein
MPDDPRPLCKATTRTDQPCKARVRPGSDYCPFHCPELAEQRAAGRRSGGKERSKRTAVLPPGTPDLPLQSVADVVLLLGLTINQLRRGEVDAKVGNGVFYGASVLLRALEGGELERRLAEVQQRMTELEAARGRGVDAA